MPLLWPMLSYQHGYHAGNHADMLKHALLARLIARLKEKDKPFTFIDTHAGAGIYPLAGEAAERTGEALGGVRRVLEGKNPPEIAREWLELLEATVCGRALYPGSPETARALCRESDSLHLMELHPGEFEKLRGAMRGDPRVHLHRRDGYSGLLGLAPPEPRRGLCLMDPSYELPSDYLRTRETLTAARRRWPAGILALWYPVVARKGDALAGLLGSLAEAGIPGTLQAELHVAKADREGEGFGMTGSGLIVLNAPWRFDEDAGTLLGWLEPLLATGPGASTRLRWLVPPV